jgi:hypothetical protein
VSRRSVLGAAATAAATAALFIASSGRWSDPLIDSGREWIVPDSLARGELLYRDVVYWFGPFTPYFQAAFLRVFGSGFPALVIAGAVAAGATLAVLHWALGKVTGRVESALWTALAIPVLVFMPNAGGILLGMGYRIWHAAIFALAAVAVASGRDRMRRRATLAGVLAAGAGLCRTEWGVVALAAAAVAILVGGDFVGARWKDGVVAAGAFVVVFAGVLSVFIALAGWTSVVQDGHVLLTGLSPETRTFLVRFSGVADWRSGVADGLYVAASWIGAFLAVCVVAARKQGAPAVRRFAIPLGICFVLLLGTGIAGSWSSKPFSGAPWISLAALLFAILRRRDPVGAMLAGCGLAGLLLSYRRPFHIGDSGYVGPPLLFALVCAAGLAEAALGSRGGGLALPATGRRLFRIVLGVLVCGAFAGRIAAYREGEGVSIAGTGGMLSARPELAERLARIADLVRERTGEAEGLVVFPEGEVLNALTGRRNPLRYKLFLPGYLSEQNEEKVIADFERAQPKAVVILYRPTSEYGPGRFGEDYGLRLRAYLDAHYEMRNSEDADRVQSRVGSNFEFGLRRAAPLPGGPAGPDRPI